LPQSVGKGPPIDPPEGADAELAPEPDDLEHKIKEGNVEVMVEFGDKKVNFRSQRVVEALDYKRAGVIRALESHGTWLNGKNGTVAVKERQAMLEALNMTIKEVNDTYTSWLKSSSQLQLVLERNYSSFASVMMLQKERSSASKKQLEQLQIEAIREESKLRAMELNERKWAMVARQKQKEIDEEKAVGKRGGNGANEMAKSVDAVLDVVGDKAEDLRKKLEEPAFMKTLKDRGANLLTVVKLGEHQIRDPHGDHNNENEGGTHKIDGMMSHLVDAENNQYALSKPKDSTIMPADINLLQDIVVILSSCFVAGYVCNLLNMPPLIGYVCTGTLVGPAGYNSIMSLVQVSTLGEFGVFFVLFTLGLEFSIARLKETWRLAVFGGSAMMLATIVGGVAVGSLLQRSWAESLFVSVCIALSSTTVVVNGLSPADQDTPYGRGLIGVLLMQDVYLGAIVATTSLAQELGDKQITVSDVVLMAVRLIGSLFIVVVVAALTARYLLPRLLNDIGSKDDSVKMLGLLAICFAVMSLTDLLGVSNELGCFVAGIMISASAGSSALGREKIHSLINAVQSVRDCFLAIFLASVGMHIYPTFLLANGRLLMLLTVAVILMKYAAGMSVWILVWRSEDIAAGHAISAGLAQVSEFGFVLASRGIRAGFLTLPVYYLLLSVSALSLLLWPFLFSMAMRATALLPQGHARPNKVGSPEAGPVPPRSRDVPHLTRLRPRAGSPNDAPTTPPRGGQD
jgi:Kef-type K+ transport system membrane component KefB